MALGTLILITAAVIVALALLRYAPGTTRRWFARVMLAKGVILGVFAFLTALYLISTGSLLLMLIGFAALVIAVLQIILGDAFSVLRPLTPW